LQRYVTCIEGSTNIENQHPILPAVEVQESLLSVDAQASPINDAVIITEHAQRRTLPIEGQQNAIPVAIDTGCARNKKRHRGLHLSSLPSQLSPNRIIMLGGILALETGFVSEGSSVGALVST
jgi:hypothetical protein